jgi:hypothetical protein
VWHESRPQLLGVVVDMVGKALNDGQPDDIRGEYQGEVMLVRQVSSPDQAVKTRLLDDISVVVVACLGVNSSFSSPGRTKTELLYPSSSFSMETFGFSVGNNSRLGSTRSTAKVTCGEVVRVIVCLG